MNAETRAKLRADIEQLQASVNSLHAQLDRALSRADSLGAEVERLQLDLNFAKEQWAKETARANKAWDEVERLSALNNALQSCLTSVRLERDVLRKHFQ